MDYKKSGAPKGGKNAPRYAERGARGTSENPFGPRKKAHDADGAKGKTDLDRPSTGDGDMAIDEQGAKNIRGPEGHAENVHEAERKK